MIFKEQLLTWIKLEYKFTTDLLKCQQVNPNSELPRSLKSSTYFSFSSKRVFYTNDRSPRNFYTKNIPYYSSSKNFILNGNIYPNGQSYAKTSKESSKVKNDITNNKYSWQKSFKRSTGSPSILYSINVKNVIVIQKNLRKVLPISIINLQTMNVKLIKGKELLIRP